MKTRPILEFRGRYSFLSNFYYAAVEYENAVYPTVEHAFQAAKTRDKDGRERIYHASSPGAAKTLGRTVKLRVDWESVKIGIMRDLLRSKFDDKKSWQRSYSIPKMRSWSRGTGGVTGSGEQVAEKEKIIWGSC